MRCVCSYAFLQVRVLGLAANAGGTAVAVTMYIVLQ